MKILYEVYVDSSPEGELVETFETLTDAEMWRHDNEPTAVIVTQEYTDEEYAEMIRESLPGLDGYYI